MSVKMIGEYTEQHLLKVASNTVAKKTLASKIFDPEREERIPKFHIEELSIGRVLGRGGFCVVNEITKITLRETTGEPAALGLTAGNAMDTNNIVQDRPFMQANCIRKGKDFRYAIKRLQDTCHKDAGTFINGVNDLAIEFRFLSVVRHPNIIKMRAVESGSPFDTRFFVVVDRLYDILGTRLAQWKKKDLKGARRLLDRDGKKENALMAERLTVAYDLSCALKYLHQLKIVYRDLKPDNIGFDVRGDVKIFDFGLAREFGIAEKTGNDDGMYKMTGDTGSPRYMAPEVALGQPYNENVDVYSFSILLWQILALEPPFQGYTMNMFQKRVIEGGARPMCAQKWPANLQKMLRRGWGINTKRPTMEEWQLFLRNEITRICDEKMDFEIYDASRKSMLSLHGKI